MKFFLDFEFHERTHKNWFRRIKKSHVIDRISIGIVSETGKEFYALFNDFDFDAAWNNAWICLNVLKAAAHVKDKDNKEQVMEYFQTYGQKRGEIAKDVVEWVRAVNNHPEPADRTPISFYGYYSDYDWVLFATMFGDMQGLPAGFPMDCRDLNYDLERIAERQTELPVNYKRLIYGSEDKSDKSETKIEDISTWSTHSRVMLLRQQLGFPENHAEHNALADAKWNLELHKWITGYEQAMIDAEVLKRAIKIQTPSGPTSDDPMNRSQVTTSIINTEKHSPVKIKPKKKNNWRIVIFNSKKRNYRHHSIKTRRLMLDEIDRLRFYQPKSIKLTKTETERVIVIRYMLKALYLEKAISKTPRVVNPVKTPAGLKSLHQTIYKRYTAAGLNAALPPK